jgi:hypothetical protein
MQDYYRNDPEATEFTDLDQEDFYEPRWNLAGKSGIKRRCWNQENKTCNHS